MVSEWMDNGDLLQYLRQNPKANRIKLCEHIAAGLSYIHDNDMIHGDIKALNIMVSRRGRAMITDFGSVKLSPLRLESAMTAEERGMSLRWMAPELVREDSPEVTRATDVYAYGLTVFETLTEEVPYADKPERLVLNMLLALKPPYTPLLTSTVNRELSTIAKECWNPVPGRRPSMISVLQSLCALNQLASSQNETSSNFGRHTSRGRSLTAHSLGADPIMLRSNGRQASTDALGSITMCMSGMRLNSPVKREPLAKISINISPIGRPSPDRLVAHEANGQRSTSHIRSRVLAGGVPARFRSRDLSRPTYSINLNLSMAQLVLEIEFQRETPPRLKFNSRGSTPVVTEKTESREDGAESTDDEDQKIDEKAGGRTETPFNGSIAGPVPDEESEYDEEPGDDEESVSDEESGYDEESEEDSDSDYEPESESDESSSDSDEGDGNCSTRRGGYGLSLYTEDDTCMYRDEASPSDLGCSSDESTSDGDWEETSSFDEDDGQTSTPDEEDMDLASLLHRAAFLGRHYRTR